MRGGRAALALLTRIPAGRGLVELRAAAGWVPAVAVVFGALAGAATFVAWQMLPAPAAAAVAVSVWVSLSGALHLDGLADTADAALAAVPRERRIEILRDVHHGSFALVAVVLAVVWKVAFVTSAGPAAGAAVFAAAVSARALLPATARLFTPLRREGMGAAFREGCTWRTAAAGAVVAGVGGLAGLGWPGLVAAGACAAAMLAGGIAITRAVGGLNGDGYGAMIELGECAALLAAVALIDQTTPWSALESWR